MIASSSPSFATACQTPAGMKIASPAANGSAPSSSRISPRPATTNANSSVSWHTGASVVPGVNTE